MHLLTNRRNVRIFGVDLPETLLVAAVGRPMCQLIEHPLFAPGTAGGDAAVRALKVRRSQPEMKGC